MQISENDHLVKTESQTEYQYRHSAVKSTDHWFSVLNLVKK